MRKTGTKEEICNEIIIQISKNTKKTCIPTGQLVVWSLGEIRGSEVTVYSFTPDETYFPMDLLDYGKKGNMKVNKHIFSVPREKMINAIGEDGLNLFFETGLLFLIKYSKLSFYENGKFISGKEDMIRAGSYIALVPEESFVISLSKNLKLNGIALKEPNVFRDLYLANLLCNAKENLYVITRELSSHCMRMYATVTERYNLYPQENIIPIMNQVKEMIPDLEFVSYNITPRITLMNYAIKKDCIDSKRKHLIPGFQIIMSDVGDASTTIKPYIMIGNDVGYGEARTFEHNNILKDKRFIEGISNAFIEADSLSKNLSKIIGKKVEDPKKAFETVYKHCNLKKAYGIGIAEKAFENALPTFNESRSYKVRDVVVQIARMCNAAEKEITHSTMETARKKTGEALTFVLSDKFQEFIAKPKKKDKKIC